MTKLDLIKYKDYYGSVHFDADEEIFYGKIEYIRDLVTFETDNAKTLIKVFKAAVEDYLKDCKVLGRVPDKPFKGTFNVRVAPDLHKEISLYAIKHNDTLNNIVNQALQSFLNLHRV